jgi:transcriptional regulator with XRE-family HTH domain
MPTTISATSFEDGEASYLGHWDRVSFGERVRARRKAASWTLAQLSDRSGLALSTISKAERGLIALTYDSILRLAYAFDMEMSELLSDPPSIDVSQIVTVERKGKAQKVENDYYIMNMLCSARTRKRMMPVLATIKAHSVEEFSRLINHPGEEFVYVLQGQLTFQIEGQAPRILEPGDSVYFDSGLGHAYLSTGDTDARLIVVCWHPLPSDRQNFDREMLARVM